MSKLPICINIDDHTPLVHVYREHSKTGHTADGRELVDGVPLEFFRRFCDIVTENGVRGKLSYVPAPGCRGDIVHGLTGFDDAALAAWKALAAERLDGRLSFGAEMLTHHYALNTLNGKWYDVNCNNPLREDKWSFTQTRGTMAPYIAHALRILKAADVHATGVTSPWMFGDVVEDEYRAAIAYAFRDVFGVNEAWYFMRSAPVWPVRCEPIPGFKLISVYATVGDHLWQSIDTVKCDADYINTLADHYITADGASGKIVDVMNLNVPVIMTTHWQSLFSNGSRAGLEAFAVVCRRVNALLADKVEWTSFEDLMKNS